MKFLSGFILFFYFGLPLLAQENKIITIDSLYREDQFYAGVTYNLLGKKSSENISQNGFSSGFHFGFIRDMPINKRRNVAIGIGVGYSGNSFNQNLLISKDDSGSVIYSILNDDVDFTKNKFSTHLIEIPFEFRWRTSNPTTYKFWRIYPGFKFSYLFTHTTKYRGSPQDYKFSDIDNFNDLQYGLTLSFGYNTVNFHLYYALNPIFDNNTFIDDTRIDMNVIKIGLMFYIL